MKKIVIFVLCILCLLGTCACSHEEDLLARYRDFEISFQGEADILFGEGPNLSNYAEAIPYYTKDKTGFVGTIVPVKYRFFREYRYDYDDAEKSFWMPNGYVEIVCDIVDVSASYNTTSYRSGDQIVLSENIALMPKVYEIDGNISVSVDEDKWRIDSKTQQFIALSEEEQQELQERGFLDKCYRVPDDQIVPSEFWLDCTNCVGFLYPRVAYDVLVVENGLCGAVYAAAQHEEGEKAFAGESHYYADPNWTAGFRQYLADHRASLGLAPIEVEK